MLKPQLPNIPGVGAVADTLDFVKNLWGSMSIPGMPSISAPTMSVDELDKKIADLKAVESWLNVNVSMLRGTIQALEVQRGTIATLKSLGATLANAVKQPGADQKSVLAAAPYASAFFSQPAPEAKPRVEVKPEVVADVPAPPPQAAVGPETAPTGADTGAAPPAAMPNPALWWNMLQDQFKQAVTTAMSSDAMAGASALAQDAASKLTAASANSAARLGKAVVKAGAASGAAGAAGKPAVKPAVKPVVRPAVTPVAKPSARKAAAKNAPAKPRVAKQK